MIDEKKQFVIRLKRRGENNACLYYKTEGISWRPAIFEYADRFTPGSDIETKLIELSNIGRGAFLHRIDQLDGKTYLSGEIKNNLPEPTADLLHTRGAKHYIVALADSFPCLRSKTEICGIEPDTWDVDRWVKCSRPWSHSERCAAMFVAMVWNYSDAISKRWKFDAVDACSVWDGGNRRAFIAWATKPTWP